MKESNVKEKFKEIEGLSYRDQLYELYDQRETLKYEAHVVNRNMHIFHNKYQSSCRKKFAEELNAYINANFTGEKPVVDEEGNCMISYKEVSMNIKIFWLWECWDDWCISFSNSMLEENNKFAHEFIEKLGGRVDLEDMSVYVSEEEVVPKMELALSFSDNYKK